jgi:hypothetical protein
MRFSLIFVSTLLISTVFSQEKFLEVEHTLLNNAGKKMKNYEVHINTSEGITFVIKAKKKVSYYLPPGEYYTVVISKDNFPSQTLIIDLLTVPENRYDARLRLPISLSFLNSAQQLNYHYEERYGKVIRKID